MKKVIHYCWFGGKPLPRKVKRCIKTWKKILPDYEIKEWNENNFDVNSCQFVREAYENKKWAFVSDYARIYALYNEGGLYLDTDVKIIKDISKILEKPMLMGYEDSGYVGTAVIGVKEKNNKYMKEILEYYHKLEHFNVDMIYNYANPIIITNILNKYKSKIEDNGITIFDENVYVYPRDYFYPLSYNYAEKFYTKNTCMVHLFNATWTSLGERRTITIYRRFGPKLGKIINQAINKVFCFKYSIMELIKKPYRSVRMWCSIHINKKKRVKKIKDNLSKQDEKYLAICHPEWIGVRNATKDIFKENILEIREQYTYKESQMIAKEIVNSGKKMVIFNAFANGWENIVKALKEIDRDIIVKIVIHGSNSLLSEGYDWGVYNIMLDLYNAKKVDELCFVKKSLFEFYKAKGYKCRFLMNDVKIDNKEEYITKKGNENIIKVGIYSSGDRWVKNTYNQLSAVSLIKNARVDCIPLNDKMVTMAKRYQINMTGESKNVSREDMYKRLANNDINLYVTFTECAPLIPLESLELGAICITGNNHHYFEGTELEKYLVVDRPDDIMAIYRKINYALENKEKILSLYKEWKENYSKEAENNVKEFLKID